MSICCRVHFVFDFNFVIVFYRSRASQHLYVCSHFPICSLTRFIYTISGW